MTRQEQILEALRTHGPMTPRQIQTLSEESLDKDSIDHTRRRLRALHKYGLIRPAGEVREKGSPPSTLWEAVE